MRVAITGGTGFVGRHLAQRLVADGHDVTVVCRPRVQAPRSPGLVFAAADIGDERALRRAFDGAEAVVHCAGINREIGRQTYRAVHVDGTAAVVAAARTAGVRRLIVLSFLRARADGPGSYHRSKWAAEEIVRASGLDHTVVKAGVIHGAGDHMLDHVSRAFDTFPVFGLVGLTERPVRPVAVADVVRVLGAAAVGDPRLRNRTIVALGPEELTLEAALRRIAEVRGRKPRFIRLPVVAHRLLSLAWEAAMVVPLVSRAQVEILAEGVVEPLPFADEPPPDLRPTTPFTASAIAAGLPPRGGFGRSDLRLCARG